MKKMTCSVCANSNQEMKGGVILWERNGNISAICKDCWVSFSNGNPSKNQLKSQAQREALMVSVEIDKIR